MILLLVGFFLACFLPLFINSWRLAFFGLALQAFFIALILLHGDERFFTASMTIQLTDLVLVRGILLPFLLIGILKHLNVPAELDLIPANLVAWVLAGSLLILSYWLGQRVFPEELVPSMQLGTVTFSILTALFILSFQNQPIGQVVGLLVFESGISLFEATLGHGERWFMQTGFTLIFFVFLLLVRKFLSHFKEMELAPDAPDEEMEVL